METNRFRLPGVIAAKDGRVTIEGAGISLSLAAEDALTIAEGLITQAEEVMDQRDASPPPLH